MLEGHGSTHRLSLSLSLSLVIYMYTSIMYMYIIYAYRHVAGYAHLDTTQIHTDIPFLRSSWCSTGDL